MKFVRKNKTDCGFDEYGFSKTFSIPPVGIIKYTRRRVTARKVYRYRVYDDDAAGKVTCTAPRYIVRAGYRGGERGKFASMLWLQRRRSRRNNSVDGR